MRVNFTEIKLLNLDGEPIGEFHKVVAQRIYYSNHPNLDLVEIALKINQGEPVELRDSDLEAIQKIVLDPASGIALFARKAFKDFIENEKAK